ncbi:hypothetical protein IQ07DRAFT_591842 [Pyrenochaeta sp. DS3sAY3a]|nr:hypothetical protein IQ07DRAFT_591842 [Pyrenochaeta sp. DS3sAY3a]
MKEGSAEHGTLPQASLPKPTKLFLTFFLSPSPLPLARTFPPSFSLTFAAAKLPSSLAPARHAHGTAAFLAPNIHIAHIHLHLHIGPSCVHNTSLSVHSSSAVSNHWLTCSLTIHTHTVRDINTLTGTSEASACNATQIAKPAYVGKGGL